jgi:amino acid permease
MVVAVMSNNLCLVISFPLKINPFRQSFFSLVMGREQFSQRENYMFTFFTCVSTCIFSILFPDIKSLISLLGGTLSVQMAFLIPLVIYVKLSDKRWSDWENLKPILFFGWLIFMGLGSVVVSIYKKVYGLDMMPRWI